MNKLFKDISVLALEQAVAAPFCSSRLADGGARVIKVEREDGDFARQYDDFAAGGSSYFTWLNRGKKSIVADIKNKADRDLLVAIARKSDVFIQNLAPGAAERAGLGSKQLRLLNPRLITVDITGYGEAAGYEQMKAYDLLIQAESGLTGITGHPAGPGRVGVSVCDIACGMAAYSAILEALLEREVTSQGKAISVSLFDCMAEWMTVPLLQYESTGVQPRRMGVAHPSICPYGGFSTIDGFMVIISIQNTREWAKFCDVVLLRPDLISKAGFATNNERMAQRNAVDALVQNIFGSMTLSEAVARLDAAGTAYGKINSIETFSSHPALRRIVVNTPTGQVSLVAPPVLSGDSEIPLGEVPAIGEHSEAIRAEFAGA